MVSNLAQAFPTLGNHDWHAFSQVRLPDLQQTLHFSVWLEKAPTSEARVAGTTSVSTVRHMRQKPVQQGETEVSQTDPYGLQTLRL